MVASDTGNVEVVDKLLQHGATVDLLKEVVSLFTLSLHVCLCRYRVYVAHFHSLFVAGPPASSFTACSILDLKVFWPCRAKQEKLKKCKG